MKFDITVELDWIDEEENLDSEIQGRVIRDISEQITNSLKEEVKHSMTETAKKLVQAKTESLIYSIMEKPVTISDGWNKKKEYNSVYEMVESRMTSLYGDKLDTSGQCTKDPLLANIEKYVDGEIRKYTSDIQARIKESSTKAAEKALEENDFISSIKSVLGEIT